MGKVKRRIDADSNFEKEDKVLEQVQRVEKINFGSVDIEEMVDIDYLTEEEKAIFQEGFINLTKAIEKSGKIERMILTNPDIVSTVIGYQPMVSLETGKTGTLIEAFDRAGLDFDSFYGLVEVPILNDETHSFQLLVNLKSAEEVLKNNQKLLGIELTKKSPSKGEILTRITSLLNSHDKKISHLTHGLLSGFPLEDILIWVDDPVQIRFPQTKISNVRIINDGRQYILHNPISTSDGIDFKRITPSALLNPADLNPNLDRNKFINIQSGSLVEGRAKRTGGFGVVWASYNPKSPGVQRHLQRMLQINRRLGLLSFINYERGGFSYNENVVQINSQKQQLKKNFGGLGMIKGMNAGIPLFGIFLMFNIMSQANEMNK